MIVKTNLPEFKSKLKQIGKDMEKRSVRQATRAAGTVIQKIAKANAPVRTPPPPKYVKGQLMAPGVLKQSISVLTKKRAPKGTVQMIVIPRSGRRSRKGLDAYYWAWVEQGHVITTRKLRGGERSRRLQRQRLTAAGRRTRPVWYLRRAFQSGQSQAVKAFYDQLEKAFVRYSAL